MEFPATIRERPEWRWTGAAGLLGGGTAAGGYFVLIPQPRSSTAGIGILFLP